MIEERRRAIEGRFINYDLLTFDERTKPGLLRDCWQAESKKKRFTTDVNNYLGKTKQGLCTLGWGSIISDLSSAVSSYESRLGASRVKAAEVFNIYMNAKVALKANPENWKIPEEREKIKKYKQDWVSASNEVVNNKHLLWQAHLQYSRFLEWYNATNDYIRTLETENESLKKDIITE